MQIFILFDNHQFEGKVCNDQETILPFSSGSFTNLECKYWEKASVNGMCQEYPKFTALII